jgi:hypothetical protein
VDLFGGDEAAAEAFREEKFMRDVKDAEDDIEFPDDDGDDDGDVRALGSSSSTRATRSTTHSVWSYDPLDAMLAKPPLAIDQTQPHERLLSRSPLERLAVFADARARRLELKSVRVTTVQSDDRRPIFDEIRDANTDPLALRERQRSEANARNAGLGWKRAKANRASHDGTAAEEENVAPGGKTRQEKTRRLSPARFASVRADGDAYVNPRLVRLAARGRGEAAPSTPGEAYTNPRLERLEAGKPREMARAETEKDGIATREL